MEYSERSKLEVDLVPCVESADGRFYVCPRDGAGFKETDGAGCREWFNRQNDITSGNIKRVVRLLKYARDHKERFDCPSIVLTTLAAQTIQPGDRSGVSVSTQTDALTTVLERMSEKLDRTPYPPSIRNPALATEEFNPKWTPGEYNRFKAVIRRMAQDARDALEETDKKKSVDKWQKVCGEKLASGQGGGAFANALGYIAEKEKKPVVSGALYRGGAVGRVRRYALFPDRQANSQKRGIAPIPRNAAGKSRGRFRKPRNGLFRSCQQRAARERRGLRFANSPSRD